nr:3-methyladenine DNA glycosylase [Mycolicibacterium komossense]
MTFAGPCLTESDWLTRAEAHRQRAERFVAPHRRRAAIGEPHPVWDFLFSYYSLRPRQLLRWNPGYGITLSGDQAQDYLGRAGYIAVPHGATVGPEYLRDRREAVEFVARLLAATAARTAQLNCFGLHEWAMVYRSDQVRHSHVPLRLGQAGTDRVVETASPLRCTHYDAFRFFTADAAPRNSIPLTRETQVDREQPGCLHASMDLYKWSYKLGPLLDTDLVLDCLELAADARELDMRASPYDLSAYGYSPIRVEEPSGRAEYVRCQSELAQRAAPLRAALQRRCDLLLRAAA